MEKRQVYFLNVGDNYEEMKDYGATLQLYEDALEADDRAKVLNSAYGRDSRNYFYCSESPVNTCLYDYQLNEEINFELVDLLGLHVVSMDFSGVVVQVTENDLIVINDEGEEEIVMLEDIEQVFSFD